MSSACWIYAALGALVPCLVFVGALTWIVYDVKYRDPLAELDRKRVGL